MGFNSGFKALKVTITQDSRALNRICSAPLALELLPLQFPYFHFKQGSEDLSVTFITNKSDYRKLSVKESDTVRVALLIIRLCHFIRSLLTRDFVSCYHSQVVNFRALNSKLDPGQLSHWSD